MVSKGTVVEDSQTESKTLTNFHLTFQLDNTIRINVFVSRNLLVETFRYRQLRIP